MKKIMKRGNKMKTLIVYSTKYGCAEKCSNILKEKIKGEVVLHNLKEGNKIDLSMYDNVIIGGSVYFGRIRKNVTEFCEKNLEELLKKEIGLFICCMRDGDLALQELKDAFPKELYNKAIIREYFGGEFIFKKMGLMDRFIAKKVANANDDVSNIRIDNIEIFANKINEK
jgi:menaquinone-dependent protoporphyrinogen oxidase